MNIFNSLGSNYSPITIWQALTTSNNPSHSLKLIHYLENRYQGKAILLYKNREALRLGLELLNLPKGSCVAITGFTCFVVDQAVIAAGCTPEYLDIDPETLNFTTQSLESAAKNNPKLKAVVVQNTLGYPCDIAGIQVACKKHHLTLIEDLAHSAGGSYTARKEIGTVGDLTVLSFSQDKIVDSVSGGALIIRNPKITLVNFNFYPLPFTKQLQDRSYPFLASSIRWLYPVRVGKYWHILLKQFHLLSSPINPEDIIFRQLPHWQSKLAFDYFNQLKRNINHRRQIARIYTQELNPTLVSSRIISQIDTATNIRFPIFTSNRDQLIKFLKEKRVYVSDIWYDTPVSPIDLCPNSEKVSQSIINLPTHRFVSTKEAEDISQLINQWLATQ